MVSLKPVTLKQPWRTAFPEASGSSFRRLHLMGSGVLCCRAESGHKQAGRVQRGEGFSVTTLVGDSSSPINIQTITKNFFGFDVVQFFCLKLLIVFRNQQEKLFIFNVTLMTGARCAWLCICWAAAAMLAMVLRWFIWDIAMATEAGGSPMGRSGWGIIMNGRSSPEEEEGAAWEPDGTRHPEPRRSFVLSATLRSVGFHLSLNIQSHTSGWCREGKNIIPVNPRCTAPSEHARHFTPTLKRAESKTKKAAGGKNNKEKKRSDRWFWLSLQPLTMQRLVYFKENFYGQASSKQKHEATEAEVMWSIQGFSWIWLLKWRVWLKPMRMAL